MLGHQLHTQAHHHVHVTKIIQAMKMPTARSRHWSTWPIAAHYIYMQLLALTQDHNICPHRITTSAHTGSHHLPTQDHNICLTLTLACPSGQTHQATHVSQAKNMLSTVLPQGECPVGHSRSANLHACFQLSATKPRHAHHVTLCKGECHNLQEIGHRFQTYDLGCHSSSCRISHRDGSCLSNYSCTCGSSNIANRGSNSSSCWLGHRHPISNNSCRSYNTSSSRSCGYTGSIHYSAVNWASRQGGRNSGCSHSSSCRLFSSLCRVPSDTGPCATASST